MQKLIYLASPYSHEDPLVREERWRAVCRVAAKMTEEGHLVFSPIAHSHPIAEASNGTLDTEFSFWARYDRAMIDRCDEVAVVKLPGWQNSRGISSEMRYAAETGKPVWFLEYEE